MKHFNKKTSLILASFFLSLSGFASPEGDHGAGNGGGIHYCPGQKSQEMYDIYEGRVRYGLQYTVQQNATVDTYLNHALDRIRSVNYSIAKKIQETLISIRSGKLIFNEKMVLTQIADANILLVDQGCEYKQLANWDDVSGNILVEKNLHEQMDAFNQAAFLLHEAIYKYDRMNTMAKSSDRTRQIVANLFSDGNLEKLLAPLSTPDDFHSLDSSTTVQEGLTADVFGAVVTLNQSTLEKAQNIKLHVEWRDVTATKILAEIQTIQDQLRNSTPRGQKRVRLIEKLFDLGYSKEISHIMFLRSNRLRADAIQSILKDRQDPGQNRSQISDFIYWTDTLSGRRVSISTSLGEYALNKDLDSFRYLEGVARKEYQLDCPVGVWDNRTGKTLGSVISENQVSTEFTLIVDDTIVGKFIPAEGDTRTVSVSCYQDGKELVSVMATEAKARFQVILGR
jgi:hypothetical protein